MAENGDVKAELGLTFENKHPFRAAEVAGMLKALASDYKRLAPRRAELAVTKLETGSLIAVLAPYLVDGVAAIAAVNALFDLGGNIAAFAKSLRGSKADAAADSVAPGVGEISYEAIAKVAITSKSFVRLEQIDGARRTILEVSPEEAREVPAKVRAIREDRKLLLSGPPAHLHLTSEEAPRLITFDGDEAFDIDHLVRTMADQPSENWQGILRTLFALLSRRPGGERILGELIEAFRTNGFGEAAAYLAVLVAKGHR